MDEIKIYNTYVTRDKISVIVRIQAEGKINIRIKSEKGESQVITIEVPKDKLEDAFLEAVESLHKSKT
jgi:hypothetical protein